MVKLLIDAGANVNLCDRKQNYPLHWASIKGSIEILNILLNAHVNPNCINDQVGSDIFIAASINFFVFVFQGSNTVTSLYYW
jgi:ankyrin repeat protein